MEQRPAGGIPYPGPQPSGDGERGATGEEPVVGAGLQGGAYTGPPPPPYASLPPYPPPGVPRAGAAAKPFRAYGLFGLLLLAVPLLGVWLLVPGEKATPAFRLSPEEWALLSGNDPLPAETAPLVASGLKSAVSVVTHPAGATVSLDLDPVGVSPLDRLALEPGTYLLSVTKEGYRSHHELVTVTRGEVPTLHYLLDATGDAPDGALESGMGERDAERALAQVHRERQETEPRGGTIAAPDAAAPGAAVSDPAASDLAASGAVGTLAVRVRPWGSIYIDGELHRANTDVAYRVELPAGGHRVRVEHPVLGSATREVEVTGDALQPLVVDLREEGSAVQLAGRLSASGRSGGGTAPGEAAPGNATEAAGRSSTPATPATPEVSSVPGSLAVPTEADPGGRGARVDEAAGRIYDVAQEPPVLIGGLEGLHRLARYPEKAHAFGVEGRVLLQFVVDEAGRVVDPVVTRGLGMGCDEEALRVIRLAQFVPGTVDGRPVRVRHALPILFTRGE
jgi:TonB family protein